nr:site-specific integrase [uncultured Dysosmobacter sp.]
MASIKKINTRKYKITVSNGYRPDGRKISRARTITVPQSVGGRGIEQYVAHEAEEFERTVKSGYCEDGEMKFEEYAFRWLDRQTKYAPSTLASYRRMLERTYPYIGAIKLNRLRPVALENMMVELRKRKCRGKMIQEKTVQKYLTVVSAVLSDAKRNEIIEKNPARMIDLPRAETVQQYIPTDEEAHRLLEAILKEKEPYRLYYLLAIYTGCRRGELCALRWSDFSLSRKGGTLTVNRSRSMVAGKGITEGTTKNGRSRVIALDEIMADVLEDYFQKSWKRERRKNKDFLFTNQSGGFIHPDTFTKHLRKIYDEYGFPKTFHLHTLRHYFVSAMLHSGVDKQTVAELAGHGDTSFLERTYCHPQLKLKNEAAVQMATNLFLPEGCHYRSQKREKYL